MKVKKVHDEDLKDVLTFIKAKGACLFLDIDDEICFSYEEEGDGEDVETLIKEAIKH